MEKETIKFDDHISDGLNSLNKKESDKFDNHAQSLDYLTKLITVNKITTLNFVLVLFILISMSLIMNISWFFSFAAGLVIMIQIMIVFNSYIKIQEIITEIMKEDNSTGIIISYTCGNIAIINIIIYLFLLTFKLEGLIKTSFSMITIPLFISLGIGVFYFIFMLPALMKGTYYFELFLVLVYLINILMFFLICNTKLDTKSKIDFLLVFIPIIIILVSHLSYNLYMIISKKDTIVNSYSKTIFILGFIAFLILLILKFDYGFNFISWILATIFISFYLVFYFDQNYKLIYAKTEEEKSPQNEN